LSLFDEFLCVYSVALSWINLSSAKLKYDIMLAAPPLLSGILFLTHVTWLAASYSSLFARVRFGLPTS
jgi:hypothetical protein